MKKTTRSFTVEYKSGRRKSERKPQSIWGDLDLRSVVRQAHDEGFLSPGDQTDVFRANSVLGQDGLPKPVLTPTLSQRNNASMIQESPMPDEIETVTDTDADTKADTDVQTDADAPDAVERAVPPVKQRKPRAKKAVSALTDSSDVTAGKPRRGRKAKTAPVPAQAPAKAPARPGSATVGDVAPPLDAIDDMAELLRLEDENRNLRKQLSEKLRTENADLRKRLNLA